MKKIYTPAEMVFRRKFAVNLYKNLRFPLGEMSLYAKWLDSDRGDPYPVLTKDGAVKETVTREASYKVENVGGETATVRRLLGQHFPYANYEMTLLENGGKVGFSFICRADGRSVYSADTAPTADIYAEADGENGAKAVCRISIGGKVTRVEETAIFPQFTVGTTFSVACNGDQFDIYVDNGGTPEHLHTFFVTEFSDIRRQVNFNACAVSVFAELAGGAAMEIDNINWYLDSGVCQADMRPIRYTDGTPMTEDGRLFFTMSSRLVRGGYQSVISWNPTGCDFRLEGAIFYDAGDGIWCADVAASVLYDKKKEQFLVWMCSFSHDHILAHGVSDADLRYGINVLDVELMPVEKVIPKDGVDGTDPGGVKQKGKAVLSDDRFFMGKSGDEDPDFYYDEAKDCWFMTVCRHSGESGKYEYFRFKSKDPFNGYEFVDKTGNEQETGGSTVKIGDKRYFFCGAHFTQRAVYNMYEIGDDERFHFIGNIKTDYDDGGFRGWGTVVPVKCGARTKYMWMTFDRFLGSSVHNWSYGNIYVYEADLYN